VEKIKSKLGIKDLMEGLDALRKRIVMVIANSILGFWFGVLPGHGATAGSFLGYGIARQYSKNKQDFGKGEVSGIMGPQCAADASAVGSLVPMLALGVPGSPTSAVLMAGLFIWGLQPGPLLFVEHADFVWGFIASIYLGHFLTFLMCLLAVPLLAAIMRVPYGFLTPFILIISVIGAYSINTQMKDVFICVIFGLIGYWLRKMKYPLAPLVVAIVLGDQTERELRKALIGSGGDPLVLVGSPVAATLMVLAFALLLLPVARQMLSRRRASAPADVSTAE
jgi:putative tricarboxylic transport membrane protein